MRTLIAICTADRYAAEEIAQKAMVEAICALHEGKAREPERLAGFLHGIARNLSNEYLRRRSLQRVKPVDAAGDAAVIDDAERARIDEARRGIERLEQLDRQVLKLSLADGLEPSAIAGKLGITAEGVRQRKSRALKRLLVQLQLPPQPASPPPGETPQDCEAVRDRSIMEAYLTGRLPELDWDAFELHYFECASCFSHLEALRMVQIALRSMAGIAVALPGGRGKKAPVYLLTAAGVAAAVAGVAAWEHSRKAADLSSASKNRPAMSVAPQAGTLRSGAAPAVYAELARFDAPPYHMAVLRGARIRGEAEFTQAMIAYSRQDWASCRSRLAAVTARFPGLVEAHYYLGICALLSNRVADGETALRYVIGNADTPYLEEAHFYLAKALLARGEAEAAKAELRKTIAMGGDLEPQAAALAARIP